MNNISSRIEVLRPKTGDTIVVHIDADHLSIQQRDCIHAAVSPLLPVGVKAMVVARGVTLTHIAADDVDVEQAPEPFHFATWLRDRNESAHREFMERTANLPPCDTSIEGIARYMGAPV
ncbi:hypothetical protein [Herbaspirillum sp. SJZ107]|uniref:hypothetical protein n=1 Tax=Herbaspirillum sp. SJZ107 TaxID=2572881 RepID=UPI001153E314|nr:hypothetical protein [Herbaspirillum sp. SJZ107]TQK10235.1 hypothetical protein FBX97_0151 [Herbaspirillum sp. SJZ107]